MYETLPNLSDAAEWVRLHPRESVILGLSAMVAVFGVNRFIKWRARQRFLETSSDLPLLVEPNTDTENPDKMVFEEAIKIGVYSGFEF
jgi:hypothetical protein